jgi:glycosyltransferase involved in cell wall biosynthesis
MTKLAANPAQAESAAFATRERVCDGVICFGGEDWWYHNRGHYDMQMMRELSGRVPVLYVNSIGMRVPRVGEGRMFLKRVLRKLKSLRRGMVRIREGFAVYSPFVAPGRIGMAISGRLLPWQVRRAARRLGIHRPLVWIACPPGAEAVEALKPLGLVYQRTDRFEEYTGVDREQIVGYDRSMKSRADITLFCSRYLYEEEAGACANALFIDHGVDYDRFERAGDDPSSEPEEVRGIARPRAGFVGGIDASTFDPPLFVEVAKSLPDVQFVMVGACSLPEDWCELSNVHFLGQREYAQVPGYMASCGVLLMPWNRSEWIRACNPVKLKEYLATGRPVVSTSFPELEHYEGHVRVADGASAFAQAIRDALDAPGDAEARRARVREETWRAKGERAVEALEGLGVRLASRAGGKEQG